MVALLIASALGAFVIAAVVSGVWAIESGAGVPPFLQKGDNVSQSDRQMRSDAFAAMAPLRLVAIPGKDLTNAIDTMHLSSDQKQALRSSIASPTPPIPAVATAERPRPAGEPEAFHRGSEPRPLRLAWITLWDTDVEDGDVVRITSQGYSRTVTLTKAPITFAIPVPDDGVVNVVGVKDGDGGGITVGLASGESKAVFPVMSVGQVLGLKIKVN